MGNPSAPGYAVSSGKRLPNLENNPTSGGDKVGYDLGRNAFEINHWKASVAAGLLGWTGIAMAVAIPVIVTQNPSRHLHEWFWDMVATKNPIREGLTTRHCVAICEGYCILWITHQKQTKPTKALSWPLKTEPMTTWSSHSRSRSLSPGSERAGGAGPPRASRKPPTSQLLGDVYLDYAAHTVAVAGNPIHLTATEYQLLVELSTRAGHVVTQDELLQRVWGHGYSGEYPLLRTFIRALRKKLGDSAESPRYIFTERGVGYRMEGS